MQLFHLTKLAEIQITKTVQTRKENNLFGNGMVVLGLATSHCWNGKAGTPGWSAPASTIMHSFVGMRLHDGRMPPAKLEVLHLFRWSTHTHPPAGGWDIKVPTMRWKWRGREMKMRWRWQWDESYLTRTQRGERKRRGKEQTPTHET